MIGVFDSGLGGLTVVKEIFRQLPGYSLVYFGDTARTPYGNKGEAIIKKYAEEDSQFLINQGAKIIIIACNTASAVAYSNLKDKIKQPLFEVINPAVEAAVEATRNKRIGVIGTRATVKTGIYERLIKEKDNRIEVFSQAAPLLVPLVEENWLKRPETKMILKKYLLPLKQKQIDTLVLGCTHYPFLKNIIQQKIGRRVRLIDSAEEVVKDLAKFLEEKPELASQLAKGNGHRFFVSDLTPQAQNLVAKWFNNKIRLEAVPRQSL